MIFFIGDLNGKIMSASSRPFNGAIGQPNTDRIIFSFYPAIEAEASDALHELHREVFEIPEPCVTFLRAVLEEAERLRIQIG